MVTLFGARTPRLLSRRFKLPVRRGNEAEKGEVIHMGGDTSTEPQAPAEPEAPTE